MVRPVDEYYSKHAERQAERYSEEAFGDVFREQRQAFVDALPGKNVLDAGCGHGRDTSFFHEKGLRPVGVDIAEGLIDYATNHMVGEFEQEDIRDLSFEANTFHGVWCCASLFFMPLSEMREVLREFQRVLKVNGVLYASMKIGNLLIVP